MQAEARVTRIEGDDAIVELARGESGGCGRCHEPGGCGGSSVIGQMFGPRRKQFRVANRIGARPGEAVMIEMSEGTLLRVALMVYLLPMLLLVAGAFAGTALFPAALDLAAAVGGAVGFALALIAVGRFRARRESLIIPVLARRPPSCTL